MSLNINIEKYLYSLFFLIFTSIMTFGDPKVPKDTIFVKDTLVLASKTNDDTLSKILETWDKTATHLNLQVTLFGIILTILSIIFVALNYFGYSTTRDMKNEINEQIGEAKKLTEELRGKKGEVDNHALEIKKQWQLFNVFTEPTPKIKMDLPGTIVSGSYKTMSDNEFMELDGKIRIIKLKESETSIGLTSYENYLLGLFLFQAKQFEDTEYYIDESIKQKPDYELSHFLKGLISHQKVKQSTKKEDKDIWIDKTLKQYQKVIELDKNFIDAMFETAAILFNKEQYELSKKELYKILTIDKNNAIVLGILALIYLKEKNHSQFKNYMEKAKEHKEYPNVAEYLKRNHVHKAYIEVIKEKQANELLRKYGLL